MTDIRLISNRKRQLKPLVEAALANELRLLEVGIRQAERRLQEFEKKYQMITQEFLSRYENDEMEETMDFAEWIGEFRLLERLREKAETLKDIRFAN
jgi:phage shock protein A